MSYTNGLDKPTDYFNTKLYTGTGSSNALTGVGFQPDFVWIKPRNEARGHHLFDAVRGVGKSLVSNEANDEEINAQTLTAYDSDGFTVGTSNDVNKLSNTHVSWNWLASNTTASNTDGSITSTVSANTTSGFSIVSYTGNGTSGATIGHGLGVTPSMIIIKNRDRSDHWVVYHKNLISNNYYLRLNLTNTQTSGTEAFNDTSPTSSVFSLGNWVAVNGSTEDHIAYCFAEKKGFSKFGSYTGNGSTDGTFVYTGFKPAMVICKKSSASGTNWGIIDNKRANSFNEISAMLNPNSSGTEGANNNCDFVSNGFKWRSSDGNSNTSGDTFIYMAFASEPFTTSTGIPCTAR